MCERLLILASSPCRQVEREGERERERDGQCAHKHKNNNLRAISIEFKAPCLGMNDYCALLPYRSHTNAFFW